MQTPVQVTFRDMSFSGEIERICLDEAEKLERYHARITGCRVRISRPRHRDRKGNLFHVQVEVTIPGAEVFVEREPPEQASDEKLELVLREAFDATRRQLADAARRRRGDVKTHVSPPHARISRLDSFRGYGVLTTADGRELYFPASSLLGATLDELELGTEVAFHEEVGKRGPQASAVRPVGRHGHRLF